MISCPKRTFVKNKYLIKKYIYLKTQVIYNNTYLKNGMFIKNKYLINKLYNYTI